MPELNENKKLHILLYSQHLSGTGHFIRTYEIARALAKTHNTILVDGGRPVPRRADGTAIRTLSLPPICRHKNGLTPVNDDAGIDDVMHNRRHLLLEHVQSSKPDVLLIEHFPFSKYELQEEILSVIDMARKINDRVKVVCSARDIILTSRFDPNPELHAATVLKTLSRYFDMLLVHSDPAICSLDEFIPWIRDVDIPVQYTGYVSEKPGNPDQYSNELNQLLEEYGSFAVLSAGGAGGSGLISACVKHWNRNDIGSIADEHALVVFAPLLMRKTQLDEFTQNAGKQAVLFKRFSPDFIDYMNTSAFSISQAGYNTCANILETRKPSVLVPDTAMSDQPARARILSELRVSSSLEPAEVDKIRLAARMRLILESAPVEHKVNLDGAENTGRLIEQLFA